MTGARVAALYVWIVLGLAAALASGWILAIARVPVIEAAPLLFGLGLAFAWGTPALLRWLYRAMR